jgi:hypothetical protein
MIICGKIKLGTDKREEYLFQCVKYFIILTAPWKKCHKTSLLMILHKRYASMPYERRVQLTRKCFVTDYPVLILSMQDFFHLCYTPCSLCRLIRQPRRISVRGATQWHFSRQVLQHFRRKFPTVKSMSNQPVLWTPDIITSESYFLTTHSTLVYIFIIHELYL